MNTQEKTLQGRAFLVTAGASGIGRATAMRIARAGGNVAVVDINDTTGEEACAEAKRYGVNSIFCHADVRDRQAVETAAASAERELGPLSGLVAAAGISVPGQAATLARRDWDDVIGVSLTGCFITCQVVGRRLIASGGGSIVTISSGDGHAAHAGRASYCAAKFGVIGYVRSLAIEWGRHGVRVNSVAPGITDTPAVRRGIPQEQIENVLVDRIAAGRMGEPEEMAEACAFLLSDAARYITGTVIDVDGGLSAGYLTFGQNRRTSA